MAKIPCKTNMVLNSNAQNKIKMGQDLCKIKISLATHEQIKKTENRMKVPYKINVVLRSHEQTK